MAQMSSSLSAFLLILVSANVYSTGVYTLGGKNVKVTSSLNEPFLMLKSDASNRLGNDKYEGYIVDLLEALSKKLNCKFFVKPSADGRYGGYNSTTNTWTGMIGEVMTGDVDLIGAGEADMAVADLTVTALRETAVDFTFPFMHVGITLLLKKSNWGFGDQIESVEDLIRQNRIKFGVFGKGSSFNFFKNSKDATNKKIFEAMESFDDVYTNSNSEGIQKVLDGGFAYFLESASAEYAMAQNCQLTTVGGLIDSKMYSIALPEGSKYKEMINIAILELHEEGVLTAIRKKWWNQANCQNDLGMIESFWSMLPSV